MAKIYSHPYRDFKRDEYLYEATSGTVKICTPNGEELTIERANFLLDCAKLDIINRITGEEP